MSRNILVRFGKPHWRGVTQCGGPRRSNRFFDEMLVVAHRVAPFVSQSSSKQASSPFDPKSKSGTSSAAMKKKHQFVPRKPAVAMTENARTFFLRLLQKPPRPDIIGVLLNYGQSQTGEPRMVFSFEFVTDKDINRSVDEGVSLELVNGTDREGNPIQTPKSPADSRDDGLPKLYVHHNAFLKVLGSTVDVDTSTITPILHDREGNRMDPNF